MAQPTIFLENRSITTARLIQPSNTGKYVMSVTHFWLGRSAVNSRPSRCSATGCRCFELVVVRNFRLQRTLSPAAFINRVILDRLTCILT